ncbi:MAG: 2-succinyl-5-enolpyruvyl-6-hydroxy-3-cyclohexene-1-carboxylic-acid synthase, partial [Prevotella sp.]
VTSGSALHNVIPAVAEAHYRHVPLIVVSADRPQVWIDQYDGQTARQPGTLGDLAAKCVQLPEPANEEEHWYCNRMVNEALLAARSDGGAPVHINVPISEPLFDFSVAILPQERCITDYTLRQDYTLWAQQAAQRMAQAKRPLIVYGRDCRRKDITPAMENICKKVTLLHEALCEHSDLTLFDLVLKHEESPALQPPDFVLHIGDTLVSKPLKHWIRVSEAEVWQADATNGVHDLLMHLTCKVTGTAADILPPLDVALNEVELSAEAREYHAQWQRYIDRARTLTEDYLPPFSQMATVKYFEQQLDDMLYDWHIHYANSNAVRLANLFAAHYVWCNRGINGIEGSLSTAAGHSTITEDMVFCIIGDLSFFYDQNALWNQHLRGNLRIVLLNNGKGGIFDTLPHLNDSPAAQQYVAATHHTTAQGICTQNDIGYLKAHNMEEMQTGIVTLITADAQRPMLIEVFTDSETDLKAVQQLYRQWIDQK